MFPVFFLLVLHGTLGDSAMELDCSNTDHRSECQMDEKHKEHTYYKCTMFLDCLIE